MNILKRYNIVAIINELKNYYKQVIITFLISIVLSGITYFLPLLNVKVIDEGVGNGDITVLIELIIIYFFLYIIKNIVTVSNTNLVNKLKFNMEMNIKYKILNYFIYSTNKDVFLSDGDLDTLIKTDVNNFINIALRNVKDIIINLIQLIISLILIINLDFQLALITIIFECINTVIQIKFNSYLQASSHSLRNIYVKVTEKINEIILNIKNIVFINADRYILDRYKKALKENFVRENKVNLVINLLSSAIDTIGSLSGCLIILIGGYRVINGYISMGVLVTFMSYSNVFTTPIRNLISIPATLSKSKASLDSVCSILEKIRIKENEKGQSIKLKHVDSISIKNLSFSYGQNIHIFENANVTFSKNEINFLIGKSGIGKSTLIKLILGKLEKSNSSIFWDQYEINQLGMEGLFDVVTFIPQEPIIFHDTIRNNITLGKEIKGEKLDKVCNDVEILDYIRSLSNDFETIIDEHGDNLSVGQKNRICLARALLQNKDVIIVDEGTAALDKETEAVIKDNIKKYFTNKIVIIITHSKEFIIKNSNIYKIENKEMKKVNL